MLGALQTPPAQRERLTIEPVTLDPPPMGNSLGKLLELLEDLKVG
jgi:hypothetical protein